MRHIGHSTRTDRSRPHRCSWCMLGECEHTRWCRFSRYLFQSMKYSHNLFRLYQNGGLYSPYTLIRTEWNKYKIQIINANVSVRMTLKCALTRYAQFNPFATHTHTHTQMQFVCALSASHAYTLHVALASIVFDWKAHRRTDRLVQRPDSRVLANTSKSTKFGRIRQRQTCSHVTLTVRYDFLIKFIPSLSLSLPHPFPSHFATRHLRSETVAAAGAQPLHIRTEAGATLRMVPRVVCAFR